MSKILEFRAYAETKHNIRITKAIEMSNSEFEDREPSDNLSEFWDEWYNARKERYQEIYSSLEPEIIEENKIIKVGISIDGRIVYNASDHVKKLISDVMQYTGLRDCKRTEEYPSGQKIFEGDIVKQINCRNPITSVVGFKRGAFTIFDNSIYDYIWTCGIDGIKRRDFEVIGHIYQEELKYLISS